LEAERGQKREEKEKYMDEIEIATLILVFLVFIMQLRAEFLRRKTR